MHMSSPVQLSVSTAPRPWTRRGLSLQNAWYTRTWCMLNMPTASHVGRRPPSSWQAMVQLMCPRGGVLLFPALCGKSISGTTTSARDSSCWLANSCKGVSEASMNSYFEGRICMSGLGAHQLGTTAPHDESREVEAGSTPSPRDVIGPARPRDYDFWRDGPRRL